jgi:hypothetical protein
MKKNILAHLKKVIVFTTITFLLLEQTACQTDHYESTKSLMKEGQITFKKPFYELQLTEISMDSTNNSFVWATKVHFPPDTTQHLFLIDTGSPTVIHQTLLQELKKDILFTYYNDYQNIEYDISQIDSLAVGEVLFAEMGVVVENFPQQSFFGKYQIKGIIGGNMIEKGVWYFDGHQKTASLHENLQTIPNPTSFQSLPIVRDVFRVAKTYLFFNQFPQKQLTTLHTGFAGGLKVPLDEWQRSGYLGFDSLGAKRLINEQIRGVNFWTLKQREKSDTSYFTTTPLLKVGDITAKNLPTVFRKGTDYQIGTDFMLKQQWVFDTKNRRILIK